jgi:hypothetical protein
VASVEEAASAAEREVAGGSCAGSMRMVRMEVDDGRVVAVD